MAKAFKLRNGTLLLSIEAPGGLYSSQQLKKIAALCDSEAAIVKATEDQRLALFVQPDKAPAIVKELAAIGLGVRNYQDGLHQPTACIGKLCTEFQQDAMGSAMDLSQELIKIKLSSPLKIGINGCSRCCVPTHTLDISVVGEASGYRISLGGKNSQIPEMASFMAEGVPPEKLAGLLGRVIEIYKKLAEEDESLQDVIERCGSKHFITALEPYSQDAAENHDEFGTSSQVLEGLANSDEAAAAFGDSEPAASDSLELDDVQSEITADETLSLTTEIAASETLADESLDFEVESDLEVSSIESPEVGAQPLTEETLELDSVSDLIASDLSELELAAEPELLADETASLVTDNELISTDSDASDILLGEEPLDLESNIDLSPENLGSTQLAAESEVFADNSHSLDVDSELAPLDSNLSSSAVSETPIDENLDIEVGIDFSTADLGSIKPDADLDLAAEENLSLEGDIDLPALGQGEASLDAEPDLLAEETLDLNSDMDLAGAEVSDQSAGNEFSADLSNADENLDIAAAQLGTDELAQSLPRLDQPDELESSTPDLSIVESQIGGEVLGDLSLDLNPDASISELDHMNLDINPSEFSHTNELKSDVRIAEEMALDDLSAPETIEDEAHQEDNLAPLEGNQEIIGQEVQTDQDLSSLADVAMNDPITEKPAEVSKTLPESTEAGMEAMGEGLEAEEVNEDEADAFEEKLNASIAEEQKIPLAEDENEADRLAAMQLVESTTEDDSLADATQENIQADSLDDLNSLDDMEMASDDIESLETLDIEDHSFDHEMPVLTELKAVNRSEDKPVLSVATASSRLGAMELSGVEFNSDGHIIVSFAGGAALTIDPNSISTTGRQLVIGGKTIILSSRAHGLNVEVDGVGLFLPNQAA